MFLEFHESRNYFENLGNDLDVCFLISLRFSLNRWYQTADGIPVKMDQGGFINIYNRSTYMAFESMPNDIFEIPQSCKQAKACHSQHPCDFGIRKKISAIYT